MDRSELFRRYVALTASVLEARHEYTKDIRLDDVTPVQYGILEYLAVHGNEPVTIGQLSDCQHMSLPNMSRELRKLGEKGLCEKFADPADKRKMYVRLSAQGQARMNETFQALERKFLARLEGVPDEELAELDRAIRVLSEKGL
ncbi:MarR family winged helix-turn-helix transcriptional regulator [Cohnella fermenti]|uniref:MarR family transcriptional regulator n=1 Tax=Cohnella fermenti TaxID=2565925 RepID=A0A4S4C8D9_9BACL|nr:MarR family transcriptional regulator [Cohnella fermenti]THF84217.1 MarR family transcriptional regulator [Cohnella fermenti]